MTKRKKTLLFALGTLIFVVLLIIFAILAYEIDDIFYVFMVISNVGMVICFICTIISFFEKNKTVSNETDILKSSSVFTHEAVDIQIPAEINEFHKTIISNFPDLPFDEYDCPRDLYEKLFSEVQKGKPSISTLQAILIDMEHHIGLKNNKSIITLENIDDNTAGYIENNYYYFNDITIGCKRIYNADSYLAILAHELAHAYQFSKSKQFIFSDKQKSERFTDALTFYLGFGILTQNGKKVSRTKMAGYNQNGDAEYETETLVLGYLDEKYFDYLFEHSLSYKIEKEKLANEKAENTKIIKEIREILHSIKTYLDMIKNQIESIKHNNISGSDFEEVQKIILKFNSTYINTIAFISNGYEKDNLSKNKITLAKLRREMEEIMRAYYFLETLVN